MVGGMDYFGDSRIAKLLKRDVLEDESSMGHHSRISLLQNRASAASLDEIGKLLAQLKSSVDALRREAKASELAKVYEGRIQRYGERGADLADGDPRTARHQRRARLAALRAGRSGLDLSNLKPGHDGR